LTRRCLAAACALSALLAGCGSDRTASEGLTDEQIEALSLGKAKEKGGTGRPDLLGLEPLAPNDFADPALRGGCTLSVANEPYLVAGPWAAVAKRNGRVLTLTVNGPVSHAGAFFETDTMSVSIGQPRSERAAGATPPGTARARINDRRFGTSVEAAGTWACGG
jgi:hypothetical protein